MRQKKYLQRFLKELIHDGSIAYGADVEKAIDAGAIHVLMLSENLEEDEIDSMYERAKLTGAEVELVGDSFEEGFQLWSTFAGKAALLRFKI